MPSWAYLLRRLLQDLAERASVYNGDRSMAENLALPVARYGWDRLRATEALDAGSLLGPDARCALERAMHLRLTSSSEKAVHWTWRAVRATPGLASEDLLNTFFNVGLERRTIDLLTHFPALARLWASQVELWLHFVLGFMKHTRRFTAGLPEQAQPGIPVVTNIVPNLSDPHSGNRTVMLVTFRDGTCWYYKPRVGKPEAAWLRLLETLKVRGLHIHFLLPRIVEASTHFWMEAIKPKTCQTEKEAGTFFFKCGAFVALLHLLRGVDFHAGNIVAHASNPVLVDCETLLHPEVHVEKAIREEMRSILRTEMLPLSTQREEADCESALGRLTHGPHSVAVGTRRVFAPDFVADLVNGFRQAIGSF